LPGAVLGAGGGGAPAGDPGRAVALAGEHAVVGEVVVRPHRRVGLRDHVQVLVVGGEVVDLVGDPALVHLAVRRLHEAVLVDARVGRQVADQPDVRALGRLDGAHPPVVGRVN